jgi:hypothetical protein
LKTRAPLVGKNKSVLTSDFRGKRTVGSHSYHRHRIEVDYQSGSKQPHSKGSADLCTLFK